MTPPLHVGVGALVAGVGWLTVRIAGRAGVRIDRWLFLDVLLPVTLYLFLLLATGRPLFAGGLTLAMGCGYAYAENAKRKTLAEPIVFTDVFQAVDIFRHPHLAVPFQNLLSIALSVLAAVTVFVVLFVCEIPLSLQRPWSLFALILMIATGCWLLAGPANSPMAQALRGAGLSGKPFVDTARFGALGTLIGYGLVARAERDTRRKINTPSTRPEADSGRLLAPVLLVQCESFFDARRLGAGVRSELLPAFDAACREGLQWGRFAVPCWGANTVRTEFAVLSGLGESAVGMDCFNPYYRFARRPVHSLAWSLRARG
jgi:hypothetical protein